MRHESYGRHTTDVAVCVSSLRPKAQSNAVKSQTDRATDVAGVFYIAAPKITIYL
jgi:hypothetical protein